MTVKAGLRWNDVRSQSRACLPRAGLERVAEAGPALVCHGQAASALDPVSPAEQDVFPFRPVAGGQPGDGRMEFLH